MLFIAHRAGTDRYPEQSMLAARYSLEQGADLVELDVRFTSEGTPVICHDENVQRVFGLNRNVADMSTSTFLSLRNVHLSECRAFTFAQALDAALLPALLHLKCDGVALQRVLETIKQHGVQEQIVLGVGDPKSVWDIKQFDKRIRVLAFMHTEADMDAFLQSECEYIRLWEPWLTQAKLDRIHACGKQVWIMSGEMTSVGYTDLANLTLWERMGADGVLINEIVKALLTVRGKENV